ncbi:acetylornithine deacetylase/succinyl-diaminopimelate desuccinylase-like protein [Pseudomonas laurylsulfativorans]|uniref:M20 family metallopeptidase n=1 Tax=Pseudomonas laurylsulfativorans TaxID=1943631 RepID=UPI00209F0445|nr:M20 family metallopeptidase [Pseudomonas laurylsulfativorans]MCP1419086.1 acetylornithine deacetylase/succinyl-diaminopimelate desuccinylase-like protein [Pseudomonas laurylsulfativorans]
MSRSLAIDHVTRHYDRGDFLALLQRSVAMPTESQEPARLPELQSYLQDFIEPLIAPMDFVSHVYPNPVAGNGPLLVASRIEAESLPTLLIYGHGDVVRGYDAQWRSGLSPWEVVVEGERWYGRGTADNKGQHLINLTALQQVIEARGGCLGFNVKLLLEMGEEAGSPGLRQFCMEHRDELSADVFIASDGPRLSAARPTVFLGSRGAFNFELRVDLRDGAHHSGNWGGLLRNPGIVLANAIASLVDGNGQVQVAGLKPAAMPESVRRALSTIELTPSSPGDPAIDPSWGEPGLTPVERVFAWNTLEVLAFKTGNTDAPISAIPASAIAHCQVRFVAGCDWRTFIAAIEAYLAEQGFPDVRVRQSPGEVLYASRLDPDNAWVRWAIDSLERTTGKPCALLPNLGGSLPNDIFADVLGLPTLWVPHSYPSCSQHAPNEHLLGSIVKEGLQIMAGLYWDLGESGQDVRGEHHENTGLLTVS